MQGFKGPHTVPVLSRPTDLEIKWSCYGEAVARLQRALCRCHSSVCSVCRPLNICSHDELVL